MVHYVATLMDTTPAPGPWAAAREAEGWHGVAVPDHVFIERQPVAHLWVTATELALATSRVTVATSFANNLLRSPVEFAQAAMALQRASGGRFEAGLGAGWDQRELEATAVRFPPTAGERAGRYIEAATIVRQLFDTGAASFQGEWYRAEVPAIGPINVSPPPLVVSVGGPRTTAALVPIADIVEVKLPGFATTGKGSFHTRSLRAVTDDDLARRLDAVRSRRQDVPLGLFVAAGCGSGPVVGILRDQLEGSIFADLFGEPAMVADALERLGAAGVGRITIGAVTPDTYELLAPALVAT
jgi:alkanesulfonate monooxygenase SsuD/methylene tetrahydromethanopterin reductase-like flavin-dependent oxidoreductase (luciferase family)